MSDAVIVINAGSSSVKFALYPLPVADGARPIVRGQAEAIGVRPRFQAWDGAGGVLSDAAMSARIAATTDHETALAAVLDWLAGEFGGQALRAAGHRVVHGGDRYATPVVLDPEAINYLESLVPLAPLHQPHNMTPIRALLARRPDLPQVACFDTAFHARQPEHEARLALPEEFWERGIRRYGFHGLSYEYVTARLPAMMAQGGKASSLPDKLVIAHLGNGASLCAVKAGVSIATTMGFSTLDGVPMGTRSGALDPGVLLHLLAEEGFDAGSLADLLYHRSGLLALSGVGSDMRTLLESGEPRARMAVDIYCYRIAREVGSLAAALGGLDALAFTAGIGEHAVAVRRQVCARSRWLGIDLDDDRNEAGRSPISTAASRVDVWVVPTNEELMIARHASDALRLG